MNTPTPVIAPTLTPLPRFLDSGIVVKLLSALAVLIGAIAVVFFGVDETTFNDTAEKLIGAIGSFVAIGLPIIWAIADRLWKPTPPMTQTAIDATKAREVKLVATGDSSPGVLVKLPWHALLTSLGTALLVLGSLGLMGCQGVFGAYQAAEDLEDTAFVIAEHYDSLVQEGIDLRDNGVLVGENLNKAQAIELRVRPLILALNTAKETYEAVQSAENAEALQAAISKAAKELSDLINALKVGGDPNGRLLELQHDLEEALNV